MDITAILRTLQVALGIGLVIFVHELGHFIAARLCKVRVEVFSLGFGPRLLGWRRGSTLYQLALVPIGGYVRMAGEERRADGLPPRPDDLSAKSVGARFFIYSGGVLMNVVFGLVVFPILFFHGVPFPPPVLGETTPGGGAWEAGLVEGTLVLEIEGHRTFDFMQIPTAVALGGSDGIDMRVRAPGSDVVRTVHVTPQRSEAMGLNSIGVRPSLERRDDGYYAIDVGEDTPAWRAGLRTGEGLVAVVGGIPGLGLLSQYALLTATGEPVEVVVQTAQGRRTVRIAPELMEPDSDPRVGIRPPRNRVVGLRDEALLARYGIRPEDLHEDGDVLVSVDGKPLYRLGDLRSALLGALAARGPGAVVFRVLRGERQHEFLAVIESEADALALADNVALDHDLESTVVIVNPGEPAALAGVVDGDEVRRIDGADTKVWEDVRSLVGEAGKQGLSVTFELRRQAATADGLPTFPEVVVTPGRPDVPFYGLNVRPDQYIFRTDGFGQAVGIGVACSWKFTQDCWITLKRILVTHDVPGKSLGGIITIGAVSYSWAESGWAKLFFFLCMLSINLAFLNVLPIPVLDGGHLFFLIVEKIKGSPVSDQVLGYSQMVGLVLILSLMVYVTYNDVVRWFLTG